MARRNKETRVQRNRPTSSGTSGASGSRNPRETAEDAQQRRSFFIWTAAITVLVVLLIYFGLFS